MPWEFTDDVEMYAERAWQLLAANPAGNTIALTVIETVRAVGCETDHPRCRHPLDLIDAHTELKGTRVSMTMADYLAEMRHALDGVFR